MQRSKQKFAVGIRKIQALRIPPLTSRLIGITFSALLSLQSAQARYAVPPKHHHIAMPAKPAKPAAKKAVPLSPFAQEAAMSPRKLIERWSNFVNEAAHRMNLPSDWVRAVLIQESGGRTMLAENMPITSSMGAMGVMQLMPDTWREMRQIYNLGNDPYDPHDNIIAGAAYLRSLYWEYGYPGMFAAYNDGPGMIEAHRRQNEFLPAETTRYLLNIAATLRKTSPLPAPLIIDAATNTPTANSLTSYQQDNDDDYDAGD